MRFWINSMGEFGDDNQIAGSVNVVEATSKYPHWSPEQAIEFELDRQLSSIVRDHTEIALYRAWQHLNPLAGSAFRFYGSREGNEMPTLRMTIEYLIEDKDYKAFAKLAKKFGVVDIEDMWDIGDGHQYAIWWDVWGKSFMEVADLQARWSRATQKYGWAAEYVNVI